MRREFKGFFVGLLTAAMMLTNLNVMPVYAGEAGTQSISGNDAANDESYADVSGNDEGGTGSQDSVSGNDVLTKVPGEKLPQLPQFSKMNMSLGRAGAAAEIPATAFTDKVNAADVTFDGKLDEGIWSDLKYEVDKRVVSTTLNNTCAFSTAWDDENFYVAVAVKDEDIVTELLGSAIYQNDGIEIFIDPDNDGVYDDHTAHFMIQVADGEWTVWGGAGKWDEITGTYQNSDMKYALADGGYTVELKVPFADMGITAPEAGMAIGLAVCNNDNDDTTQIDRQELHWVENFSAGDASTWGCAYLSSDGAQMISWPGTAAVDGILSEGYELTETAVTPKSYTAKAASLCDSEYLYLAYDITLADAGKNIADVLKADDKAELRVFLSGDNDQLESRSPNNHDLDLIISLKTGTVSYFRSCDADPADAEGKVQYNYINNEEAKVKFVDNGPTRTIEIAVPWNRLNQDRDYLTTIGMETVIAITDQAKWSNAPSPWQQSRGYGAVVLNSKNVATPENMAPGAPNQINSYSIAQGASQSGRINVTDPEGDTLSYEIAEPFSSASDGTFELDETTGEWSYTPPSVDFVKPSGVNYFVETSDIHGGTFRSRIEIRVEHAATNLTWHVDGDHGSDSNDGKTRATAFKTIMKAHSVTNPGDTVLIYDSEVPYGAEEIILSRSGLPDAYITYKAAPGNSPTVNSNGLWNTIKISGSYIKIEGLNIEGIAEQVTYEEAYKIANGKMVPESDPEYVPGSGLDVSRVNTNGINVAPDSRIKEENTTMDNIFIPHHVEVRNCVVSMVSGGGVVALEADYVTFENNTITNCCWWDIYACSGISVLDTMDINDNTEDYKVIIRNNMVGGNRHFMPWAALKRLSDGNGIIVDSNNHITVSGVKVASGYEWGVLPYAGRTLVANNLCYENGGSGMHVFDSNHVDMINNTVYSNVATVALGYSDFYASQANDVNMFNNIIYSRSGNKMNITSSSNQQVVYDNNLFYNYDANNNNLGTEYKGTVAGSSNKYGTDPMFVKIPVIDNNVDVSAYPSDWTDAMKSNAEKARYDLARNYDINQYEADFTLKDNSPAMNAGNAEWSAKIGNTDNRLGVFGTIGAETKPGTYEPGTDTPGTDEPGTDTPGTDEPGTDTPGTDEPGTDTPGTDEPGTSTPGSDSAEDSGHSTDSTAEEVKTVFTPVEYIVVKGDTLARIAWKNNLSITVLLSLNPQIKNPNRIYPGQLIVLGYTQQKASADTETAVKAQYYIVQRGDSLYKIASRHGLSLHQFTAMNTEIARQRYIYAGQIVRIR